MYLKCKGRKTGSIMAGETCIEKCYWFIWPSQSWAHVKITQPPISSWLARSLKSCRHCAWLEGKRNWFDIVSKDRIEYLMRNAKLHYHNHAMCVLRCMLVQWGAWRYVVFVFIVSSSAMRYAHYEVCGLRMGVRLFRWGITYVFPVTR